MCPTGLVLSARGADVAAAGLRSRPVLVLGLTGGIGSGKSTASALLEEKGAVIVDADRIARQLQEPGQPVFEAMVEAFGAGSSPTTARSTVRPWPTSSSTTTKR